MIIMQDEGHFNVIYDKDTLQGPLEPVWNLSKILSWHSKAKAKYCNKAAPSHASCFKCICKGSRLSAWVANPPMHLQNT